MKLNTVNIFIINEKYFVEKYYWQIVFDELPFDKYLSQLSEVQLHPKVIHTSIT